ncbi:MAG: sugar-binding transcriptional regulator [Chloroflexi bacterium]|nr:MAG: sugar-binding transcriptional regulator [Chloroflexota bacterium]MBL1195497.1 sugar-binding transcriptional regulator [Chloroflexota bacterium]NOH12779.1 sugar-binding transcriptional regulator [Chloroflexota bacterium]
MAKAKKGVNREELLADVAEMYYLEDKTQAEISKAIGITRSAISRILTEARQKGIVDIRVRRPLSFDSALEDQLQNSFKLERVHVINSNSNGKYDALRERLGRAGAKLLEELTHDDQIIGVAWGTTVNATIEAYEHPAPRGIRVVQLVGVLGATRHTYSGQALVENLVRKLSGEGTYLYTPFIVESAAAAQILMNDRSVQEAITMGRQANLALSGIGSTDPEYCSLYKGGHISDEDLKTLQEAGAVGDVAGHYYDIMGRPAEVEFHERNVGISKEDFLSIPLRFAVAGGLPKAEAITGAICGGYVNALVTDDVTAAQVLALAAEH